MARPRNITKAFDKIKAKDRRFSTFCRQHMSELEAQLRHGRMDWRTALQVFSEFNLTDELGRPLTVDTASRTWRRVRAEVTAQRAECVAAPAVPNLLPGEIAPGVRRVIPASVPGALIPEAPPARHPAPAHPAAAIPLSPAPTAPNADGPAGDGATELIRFALERLGSDRVSMPKKI